MFGVSLESSWPQDDHPVGAFPDFRIRVEKSGENSFVLLQALPVLFTAFTCNVPIVFDHDFSNACHTVGHD